VRHRTFVGAFVAAAGIAAAALAVDAQTPPGPVAAQGSGTAAWMPASDADFVRALAGANTTELELAKYVVNRTKNPDVHAFAQHMIDDHSAAAVQLDAATRGTNLHPAPTPRESTGAGRSLVAVLQSDSGTKLDDDYMRMQVAAHRRALAIVQWGAQNATNTGLKTLATNLTPTVQQHLQLAQAYLSAHNLTPYDAPMVVPIPGNPNPTGAGAGTPATGIPNNPAAPGSGSTSGQQTTPAPTPAPATSPQP